MRDATRDFFETDVPRMEAALSALEERTPVEAEPRFDGAYEALSLILGMFQQACAEVETRIGDNQALLEESRKRVFAALSPWFDRSWVGERARHKPRGYPGDYELLTVLYNHQPVCKGLAGYIDLYLLELLLTRSIRSRWQKIREFLISELACRRGDVSILNIASGACREFTAPLESPSGRKIHLQCLDNDQKALDFVRANVVPGSGIDEFCLDRFNALRLMSSRGVIRRYGKFDIVYSIGLFDYIPDEPLTAILRSVRELLNPGGVAYINFKDSAAYDKTPYQWWMDWHFFQRSVADCERLFHQAGYDVPKMTNSRDDTGVIVNFVSQAPAPQSIRVDLGTASPASPTSPTLPQPWQDSEEV